jgi:predicted GNAT family acetyltransferase
MSPEIQHDEPAGKFFTILEGREAHLTYKVVDEHALDFRHTYVPVELRGRGLAKALVAAAFAHAGERGYRVIPTCSFVRWLADRVDEYGELTLSH